MEEDLAEVERDALDQVALQVDQEAEALEAEAAVEAELAVDKR